MVAENSFPKPSGFRLSGQNFQKERQSHLQSQVVFIHSELRYDFQIVHFLLIGIQKEI